MADNIGLITSLIKKHGGGNGTSKKNFSKVVTTLEWVLVSEGVHSGFYKLDVLHSLKSSDILVEFYENNISSNLTGVEIVDENTISLYNDTALNGKVVVNGGFNEGTSLNNEQVTNINKIPQMERDIASNKTTLEGVTKDKINNWDNAHTHSQSAHAPANAQRNSDITKAEIEAKLVGDVNTHSHSSYEPVISNKGTAFNKNFGTNEGDIAQGNHTHTGYANASHRHNASEIDGLSSGGSGVNVEIVNDLTTGGIDKVLSAEQGKVIKSSLDDIKTNTYNKLEVDKKISEIVLESGNIVLRDVLEGEIFELSTGSTPTVTYGNIIISTTTLTVNENTNTTFTIKLDKAPTNNQVVNIAVNNGYCTINPTTLTFTSSNYNQPQTITVTGVHDSSHYSAKNSTITVSSANVTSKNITVTINNIDSQPSENTPVQSIALNKSTHTMKVNETLQLTPVITPSNATNQEVTWEANNSNCTVVGGLVTAKIEGECTITCKTVDGNKTDTCVITVQAKDSVVPSKGYVIENLDVMYDLTKYENGYIGNVIDEINGIQAIVTGQDGYETGRNGFIDKKFMINTHSEVSKKSTFTIPNRSSFVNYPFSIELYIALRGNYNRYAPNNTLEFNNNLDILPSALHNSVVFDTKTGGTTGHGVGGSIFSGNINANGPVGQPNFSANTNCKIYGVDGEYAFYHLVWCFNSNSQKIYVDGVKIGEDSQKSIALTSSDRTLAILNSVLAGDLKLIRVYNSILTDEEVSKNYNNVISTIGGNI